MGAGASVPDEVSFDQAKALAGDKWEVGCPPARTRIVICVCRRRRRRVTCSPPSPTAAATTTPPPPRPPPRPPPSARPSPRPSPAHPQDKLTTFWPESKDVITKDELFAIIRDIPSFATKITMEERMNVRRGGEGRGVQEEGQQHSFARQQDQQEQFTRAHTGCSAAVASCDRCRSHHRAECAGCYAPTSHANTSAPSTT